MSLPKTTVEHTKAHLSALMAALLWSSALVAIRVAVKGYSPGGMGFFRYAVAGLVMVPIFFLRPNKKPVRWRHALHAGLIGMLGIGLYNVALNRGEVDVTAAVTSFIISQIPIFATLISVMFLGERLKKTSIYGIIIAFFGIGIIVSTHIQEFNLAIGLLFLFIAVLAASAYHNLQKPLHGKLDPIAFASCAIWGGMFSLLMFAPAAFHEIQVVPMHMTIAVIYLGIFPGALGYLCNSYALSHLPVSKVMAYIYMIPILTTLMGWLFIHEIPEVTSLIGGGIALLGAYLVRKR